MSFLLYEATSLNFLDSSWALWEFSSGFSVPIFENVSESFFSVYRRDGLSLWLKVEVMPIGTGAIGAEAG